MYVLGRHCYLLSNVNQARTVDVGAFTESTGGLNKVPIFDAMLGYDCKQINQVYLLVLVNVLYIDSMEDNLIQPFILRETGLTVNERENIYCEPGMATNEDQTIKERETSLFITLQLRSVFWSFKTRTPDEDNVMDGVVVVMTPEGETWEPYDESYVENERSLTNTKGRNASTNERTEGVCRR